MLSSYYPTNPDEGSETSLQSSSSATAATIQPYWSNMDTNPWMTSDMHPSMLAGGHGQYNTTNPNHNTWGQPVPTSAPDSQAWGNPYDYGSVNNNNNHHHHHHHHIQTSKDASPNDDYFGAVDYNSQDPSQASWDPNDQPMFSSYSEVPPQIGGLGNSTNMAISPMNPPHQHHPYSSAQIPSTASLSTSPPNPATIQQSSYSTKPSKSKSPKTSTNTSSSKSKSSSTSSSSSNKRKASGTYSSSSSKQTRDLNNKLHLPQEVHRIASEHISREAWRICKAEAIEMEQRRVQLLQNGSGKLEREMLEQRQHLNMIRQGVMREQGVLEDVLRRAERLGSGRA